MLVILSQKVDSKSSYADELFNVYHYPARYRNQLHKGDVFVYYQGDRYDKSHRYYFGIGTIGEILTTDGENYYAKLIDCQRFENNVPIYLPDGGYIEQLGYESVRKNMLPPWQSSVRPLSQEAFDYILNAAGIQQSPETSSESIDILKCKLKTAVRDFYVGGDQSAIHRIQAIASAIERITSVYSNPSAKISYMPSESPEKRLSQLIDYCKTMKMSYSYKPVLILALLHSGDKNGSISMDKATVYFRDFYSKRKSSNLIIEKKKCIYLRDNVTDKQIMSNIISNPVKALIESGYFFYNEELQILYITPEIWNILTRSSKAVLTRICHKRLNDYYGDGTGGTV